MHCLAAFWGVRLDGFYLSVVRHLSLSGSARKEAHGVGRLAAVTALAGTLLATSRSREDRSRRGANRSGPLGSSRRGGLRLWVGDRVGDLGLEGDGDVDEGTGIPVALLSGLGAIPGLDAVLDVVAGQGNGSLCLLDSGGRRLDVLERGLLCELALTVLTVILTSEPKSENQDKSVHVVLSFECAKKRADRDCF